MHRIEFNPNRLKAERIASNKSQEDIAKAMNWSRGKYIRVERGESDIGADELGLFAEIVGIEDMRIFFIKNDDKLERFVNIVPV